MNEPLVSIIMGAYNCENSICKCIDSIICQTYSNWELVICDDCSIDNTLNILNHYGQKDGRIKVLHNKENLKLAATLNRCLEVSAGKYIARMDSDDECLPERISKQVDFLEKNKEYAVVGCAAYIFDGEIITGIRKMKNIPKKDDVLLGPVFIHPSILMKKEVYDVLGGYTVAKRTQRGQDWDLWFRFYALEFKGYNLQEPLIKYHEDKNDYKKRTFKAALGTCKTAVRGFEILHVEKWKYYLIFRPIISFLVPERIKRKRRREII